MKCLGPRVSSPMSPVPRLASCLTALILTIAPVYAGAAEIVHVVGKGQTLGRIAKRYRVSVDALREANGLRAGERIHPGLSLVIPSIRERPARKGADRAAHPAGRGGQGAAKEGGRQKGKRGGPRLREPRTRATPASLAGRCGGGSSA